LRLPGQWDHDTWAESSSGGVTHYNVHRWYESRIGRYTRIDPLPTDEPDEISPYLYVYSNPLTGFDPLGLSTFLPCSDLPGRPCPSACDSEQVSQAATVTLSFGKQFCKYKNSPERPPGIPSPGESNVQVVGRIDSEGPVYRPRGNPCLDWCTCQHEQQHFQDVKDPRVTNWLLDGLPLRQIANWLECRAYKKETPCLQGLALGGGR
jgi:RHS repeat-associated protein